mmetsp:Transcript_20183/g.77277  ORF Transcript_20183/g.77277 Transcript_20183/m.77277 type:complete len:276 (-) Transcript_20183:922-1749(-)
MCGARVEPAAGRRRGGHSAAQGGERERGLAGDGAARLALGHRRVGRELAGRLRRPRGAGGARAGQVPGKRAAVGRSLFAERLPDPPRQGGGEDAPHARGDCTRVRLRRGRRHAGGRVGRDGDAALPQDELREGRLPHAQELEVLRGGHCAAQAASGVEQVLRGQDHGPEGRQGRGRRLAYAHEDLHRTLRTRGARGDSGRAPRKAPRLPPLLRPGHVQVHGINVAEGSTVGCGDHWVRRRQGGRHQLAHLGDERATVPKGHPRYGNPCCGSLFLL